jgi:hypothetical protein
MSACRWLLVPFLISLHIHKQGRPANFSMLEQIAKIIQVVVAKLIVIIVDVFNHCKKV